MDVTRDNFIELLPEISDTIRECDFIAIDTELSGLTRERNNNRFDVPEERFAKFVESSRGFFIMQFGLSCFTRNASLAYSNKTYNFYIFPQPNSGYGDNNRTFSLQAQSIQFLTEHGFDFNKLFKHGVSYLTFKEKQAITAQLKSENKARSKVDRGTSTGLPVFVPQNMSENCRDWLNKVKSFVAERKNSMDTSESGDTRKNRLYLRTCNTKHKRNIFKRVLECEQLIENIVIGSQEVPDKDETYLVIDYIDKEVKKEKEKNELIAAKGFLEILELVILNKKPIVGHNLTLDLIQIINQFMEPLTNDYSSFKELCNSLFPYIYDTKYIATLILDPDTLSNNQTRLLDLYCQLRDSDALPKIQVTNVGKPDNDQELPHQAGYDAYMCGYSFIVLCESYLKEKRKKSSGGGVNLQDAIAQNPIIVGDFVNKIHLSFSYDHKYFNIGGDEENPNRDHVLYVEFPETWTLDDIFQAFHSYGGVTVGYLSKTSALCALRDPKQISSILGNAKRLKGSNYTIHSYESYLENFKRAK